MAGSPSAFFNKWNGPSTVEWHVSVMLWLWLALPLLAVDPALLRDAELLHIPTAGSARLRILAPDILELGLINIKPPDPDPVEIWNFVDDAGFFQAPSTSQIQVQVNGSPMVLESIGFKRAPLYAPIAQRDLRVANSLYLKLSGTIAPGQSVSVQNPDQSLWPASIAFQATMDPLRFSPAIHVNQEGYMPGFSKKAMVGYYLRFPWRNGDPHQLHPAGRSTGRKFLRNPHPTD